MKLLIMSSNALKIAEGTDDDTCGRFFASTGDGRWVFGGWVDDVDVVVVGVGVGVGVVVFGDRIWAFSSIPTEDTLRIGE